MPTDQPKNNTPKRPSEERSQMVKYSDLAFRMGAMIAIGAFAGQWLDKHFALNTPIFTIILCLFAIGGAMYMVIRDVSQPK